MLQRKDKSPYLKMVRVSNVKTEMIPFWVMLTDIQRSSLGQMLSVIQMKRSNYSQDSRNFHQMHTLAMKSWCSALADTVKVTLAQVMFGFGKSFYSLSCRTNDGVTITLKIELRSL